MAGNMNAGSIFVRLGLDSTPLTQGLSRASSSLNSFGNSATRIGKDLSLKLTAPLALIGRQAIKTASDFEASLGKITGLVGVASSEVKQMGDSARSMSVQFGKSAGEAGNALFFITSAGLRGADAMAVLEQSMKASAVGLGDTATIADLATSAVNAYGINVLSAANATDTMVATVREGKLETTELAGSMGRVLPLASAMGVSFNEVGAAFAALSRTGTNASEAATQIRGILASLLRPTKQAEEALTGMGLSAQGLRDQIKTQGLLSTLELLANKFDGNEAASAAVFGNIRALSGVLDLMGANVETTRQIFANMENNLGDTDNALIAVSDTAQFKMSVAMAQVKDALLSVGQVLIPIVVPIMEKLSAILQKVAGFFNSLPGPIKNTVAILGTLAAVAGPLLITLGAMAKAFAAVGTAAAIAGGASATAGVGAFTLGLSKMIPLLANPALLGGAAVVGGLAFAFTRMGSDGKEAREKQERLTQALRDAKDPTYDLVGGIDALAERYGAIADVAPQVIPQIISTEGAFAASEIAAAGLADIAQTLGIDFDELGRVARSGTDILEGFSNALESTPAAYFEDVLKAGVEEGVPFADAMLEAFRNTDLLQGEIVDLVSELDLIVQAFALNREEMEANARATLEGKGQYQDLAKILGVDVLNALISTELATAKATGSQVPYADALAVLIGEANKVVTALEEEAAAQEATGESAEEAATGVLTLGQAIDYLQATSDGGQISVLGLADKMGILSDVMANELSLYLMDVNDSADEMFSGLADGESTLIDVERAAREMSQQILEVITDTANLGGETSDAIPSIIRLVDSLYDGAKAADVSREEVRDLITEIGILDGLSPEIALALTLDVSTIKAQIQALTETITKSRSMAEVIKLSEELANLQSALTAIEQIDTPRPSGGGGRGGSGRTEDPFEWVEGWVKDLTEYTATLFETDFAERLVDMSAPEIAKALAKVIERGYELAINLLPGGQQALDFIAATSLQLQDMANQLGGENGLNARYAEATRTVQRLESELEGLNERFREFQRIERGIGEATTLQRLDEELARLEDMKTTLAALRDEYAAFRGEGVTALDEQRNKLDSLGSTLADLEQQYADLNKAIAGATGLERELQVLDDLSSGYERLKASRESYAESTAASLSSIAFGARGGALFSAKRYLQKVESFRDIITSLRDRAFPPSIIRDVIAAGLDGGTAIGRKLLALGDDDLAEFKRVQEQIQAIAAQTGQIAADVLFTADVNDAEAAFNRQLALVQQMYQQAIAQARNEFQVQQAIVEGVFQEQIAQAQMALEQQKTIVEGIFQQALAEANANLDKARQTADILKTAIDDLRGAMLSLIQAIADAVNKATQTQQPGQTGGGAPTGGPNYLPGGMPGQVTAPPPGLLGGSPATPGTGGWEGLGFDARGGGYLKSPTGDVFYLEPGIDFGSLGRRAKGGPVTGGQTYMVGELGPELFTPRTSGTIIPNDAMAMAGGTKNYTINVNVAGGQSIGREVVRAIEEYERRNGAGWRS